MPSLLLRPVRALLKTATKPISRPAFYSTSISSSGNTTTTSKSTMKIAITGARGTVGREVVKLCAQEGHATVQVDRTEQEYDGTPNSTMRTADVANDYDAFVNAIRDCEALIHLAAVPNPLSMPDWQVHQNNVCSAFNGFRAAGEVGIRKICYASSVNAIGLAYSQQPLSLPYFPIDEEEYPCTPSDSYALAKLEAETAAKAFPKWFPGTKIACLRIHEVETRANVLKEHKDNWQDAGVKQLWGWVNPVATARACLAGVTNSDRWEGCEIFNIIAPTTTLDDTTSGELAKKYYPDTELRGDWNNNRAFWSAEKAEKILGWTHDEKE